MSIHTTQIGKHKFVCGLFWQSLSRPRELAKEAAELANTIDCDLVVLRKNQTTAQAGYASTQEGARANTYSLAALVSEILLREGAHYDGEVQPVHNWLGAFKLPDGMWAYFAVRDANFLPNGDYAGSQQNVIDRLLSDYALGGWNVVIGDAELADQGFHNFIPKSLETLLPRKKNGQIRVHQSQILRPVAKRMPAWKIAALSFSIAASVSLGLGWLYKSRSDLERQHAFEEASMRIQNKPAVIPAPHPWPAQPLPYDLIRTCLDKLDHVTAGGWLLDQYSCTPTRIEYSWLRNGSAIEYLKARVPEAMIEINGEKAAHSIQLTLDAGRDEKLLNSTDLLEPFISKMQLLGLPSRFTKASSSASTPPNKNVQYAPPDWQTYSFVLNAGAMRPLDLASVLDRPGIRIDKLTYRNAAWLIEGVMYAK